jgi:hypothetical protein
MSPTQDPRSSDPSSGPSGQPESQAPPGTTKDMEQAPDHGEKSYKGTGKERFLFAAHHRSCEVRIHPSSRIFQRWLFLFWSSDHDFTLMIAHLEQEN